MKNMKKILTMMGVIALTAAIAIGGTLAYLTSTAEVKNTFSVGKVTIDMDEAKVDGEGHATNDSRVKANTYNLLPGHKYDKDPVVYVEAKSEDCYLFLELDNQLKDIIVEKDGIKKIEAQILANGWALLDGSQNIYTRVATKSDNRQSFSTFTAFVLEGDGLENNGDGQGVDYYDGKQIVVNAYAVQKDGFASAKAAWDETFGKTPATPDSSAQD